MTAKVMDRLFEEILPFSNYALGAERKGLEAGRREGEEAGRREQALKTIRLVLAKRFPGVPQAMTVPGKHSIDALDAALESLVLAASEEEARTILARLGWI